MSDDKIVRLPVAREHRWHRDGNIDIADTDKLAWAICPYLRNLDPCKGCPHEEHDHVHGAFHRGCRMMAEEVINICQTGHPHRKT